MPIISYRASRESFDRLKHHAHSHHQTVSAYVRGAVAQSFYCEERQQAEKEQQALQLLIQSLAPMILENLFLTRATLTLTLPLSSTDEKTLREKCLQSAFSYFQKMKATEPVAH